ncbi:MAG: N-acetylglucosamine-6-phosphate deacetylase [Clostridia bacterium]|nr:N-acetylglucosamine-6-phosphate deacetylase [Clostridia bacterium]
MKGFKNVKAYLPDVGVVTTNIGFENGKIVYIGDDASQIEAIAEVDGIVVPGFIDQHIHGAGGSDGMDGTEKDLQIISETVAREGTTAFLVTTMTQSPENISKALVAVKEVMQKGEFAGAEAIGVHLEGPFISPKHVGAQPLEYVAKPSVEIFDEYDRLSGGNIKIVTLAPEQEGGAELVEHLAKLGKVASIGHTASKYADVESAVKVGAKNVTHTYNAQTALHHREVGVVGSAMLFDELNCELICDLIHLCAPAIRLVVKNKPHNKVTLITDAMRAKGMPDGISELGGQTVIVKNGEARLEDGTLAGSVLKMNDAIKNVVTKVGVSFTDAIDFATKNPAENIGVLNERGTIEVGKRADFAVLNDSFEVLQTVVGGKIVYKNN